MVSFQVRLSMTLYTHDSFSRGLSALNATRSTTCFPSRSDAQGLAGVHDQSQPSPGRDDAIESAALVHDSSPWKWYPDCFRKRQPALDPSASHEIWAQGRHSKHRGLATVDDSQAVRAGESSRPRGFASPRRPGACARSPIGRPGLLAFDGLGQNRNHGVNVAHNAVVGVVEDQGLVIFVHGHDDLRGADAHGVLHLPGYTEADVQ